MNRWFGCLKRKAAPGIDGVTHAEYAEDLAARLEELEKHYVQDLWIKRVVGKRCNSMMTGKYQRAVYKLLHKWLNRHSQSRSMNWGSFARRWTTWRLRGPVVVEKPQ